MALPGVLIFQGRPETQKERPAGHSFTLCAQRMETAGQGQSMALKLNSPPSLMPENQRAVTVLVFV